jgi:hypothetical protein
MEGLEKERLGLKGVLPSLRNIYSRFHRAIFSYIIEL